MKKLVESHAEVALSREEILQVTNWLDVNGPFHPSYWGRLNAKFTGTRTAGIAQRSGSW